MGADSFYQHTSWCIYRVKFSFTPNARMFVNCFFSSKIIIQYNTIYATQYQYDQVQGGHGPLRLELIAPKVDPQPLGIDSMVETLSCCMFYSRSTRNILIEQLLLYNRHACLITIIAFCYNKKKLNKLGFPTELCCNTISYNYNLLLSQLFTAWIPTPF